MGGSSSDTLPPSCFDWIGAIQIPVLSKVPSIRMDENADEALHVGFVLSDQDRYSDLTFGQA